MDFNSYIFILLFLPLVLLGYYVLRLVRRVPLAQYWLILASLVFIGYADVAYYPFLLGKQEDLVDYVLREETVSRLHVRIDRAGEEYFLTDLNSTNGTTVNGRKLETNETVKLSIGDQVGIARLSFYFR